MVGQQSSYDIALLGSCGTRGGVEERGESCVRGSKDGDILGLLKSLEDSRLAADKSRQGAESVLICR